MVKNKMSIDLDQAGGADARSLFFDLSDGEWSDSLIGSICRGDIETLCYAQEMGFAGPAVAHLEWNMGLAMREASGASARWLLDVSKIKQDSPARFMPCLASAKQHLSSWSLGAMEAVESFAGAGGGARDWLALCAGHPLAQEYSSQAAKREPWIFVLAGCAWDKAVKAMSVGAPADAHWHAIRSR